MALRTRHKRWLAGLVAFFAIAVLARWTVHSGGAEADAGRWPDADELAQRARWLQPLEEAPPLAGETGVRLPRERDPFHGPPVAVTVPPPVSTAAPRSRRVSAILVAESSRMAVVDDRLVGVGDTLDGGARVAEIASGRVVVVEADGTRRVLTLDSEGDEP